MSSHTPELSADEPVSAELRRRHPLARAESLRTLKRMQEHPDAPRWNHAAGDCLDSADLDALRRFRADLDRPRQAHTPFTPPDSIINWVARRRTDVPLFRELVPEGTDLAGAWNTLPTMSRETVAMRPETLIAEDADLDPMIVYRTAGTTGHALLVPSTPRAAAAYQPMIERALARYGVTLDSNERSVVCFNVGAQARTVTYPTVLAYWNGAGFAKLNLRQTEWRDSASAHRYFADFPAQLLTGDPISFAEMMRLDIPVRPRAMLSTAVAMSERLRRRLSETYQCPVIDWYSLTETGPLGYLCPRGQGYHVLPHDVYLEAVDPTGASLPAGVRGEITVTGGRNPFLPLLRYRTGDWGRMDYSACPCGDTAPRILDLEGRAPVLFRASDGGAVNPVDVSRVLREFPFVQHEFTQTADGRCDLVARVIPNVAPPCADAICSALAELFGGDVGVSVRFDDHLGDRADKIVPYRSEMLLED